MAKQDKFVNLGGWMDETTSPIHKGKRKWQFPRYKTMIMSEPKNFMDLSKTSITRVRRMDDEIYSTQTTFWWDHLVWIGFICFILLCISGFRIGNPYAEGFGLEAIMFTLFFVIFPAFALIHALKPQKRLTLDRVNGTISIPPFFWGKPKVVPFDVCLGMLATMPGAANSAHYRLEIWPNDKRKEGGVACPIDDPSTLIEYWSLLVWYMDKNRPLPPCKELDPYRERDFERRKAEGFPLPLYISQIHTPEATPEQQRERDKVWPKNLAGIVKNKK